MKRILGGLIALIALASLLTGCGDATAKQRIGISIPSADHGWTGGIVWWAEQAKKQLEEKGCKVILSTAKDSAEQVDKVENLLVQDLDALVILPHEPSPLTAICKKVAEKGIFLTVVDRGLDEPVHNLYVAGDNAGFGRLSAETMVKQLNGKGRIVVMEGIPCAVNSDRVNAFNEVMKANPGIEILASQSADWNTEKGLKLMENYLQKFKEIDGVWTGDDDVLLGALKAYEESGRKDIKCFIGGAGSKAIVKMVLDKNPLVPSDVTYPPRMIENAVLNTYNALAAGQRPAGETVIVPAEVITPENAADFYFPDSMY